MASKKKTIQRMACALMDEAGRCGASLSGLTLENFNTFLDDAFGDGGEARCIHFVDLADPYAVKFGPIESRGWDGARWECIRLAIKIVQEVTNGAS